MKRFDPEKELNNQTLNTSLSIDSKISNAFIPLLVLGCSCLAMIGVAFSYKLIETDKDMYKVHLTIVNGEEEEKTEEAIQGNYRTRVVGNGDFSSITCNTGSLEYDKFTETVYTPNLNQNTDCIIVFDEANAKYLSVDGLTAVNDNTGVSYYYSAASTDNYLKLEGMMFRIVRINGNGSLRIMLDKNDLRTTFGSTNNYFGSNLKKAVETWYDANFKGKSYVVAADFDINNYVEYDSYNLINFEEFYESKVGVLSVREAELILKDAKESYLGNIVLANANGATDVYSIQDGQIISSKISNSLLYKPVINIMVDDLDGIGTLEDPYRLKED